MNEEVFQTDDYSIIKCAGCDRELKCWNLCTTCFKRIRSGGKLKAKVI